MIVNNLLTICVNKSLFAENLGFTKTFRNFSEKVSETFGKTDLKTGKPVSQTGFDLGIVKSGQLAAIFEKKMILCCNMLAAQDVRKFLGCRGKNVNNRVEGTVFRKWNRTV